MTALRVLQVIPSVAASDGGPSKAISLIEHGLTRAGVSVTTLTTDHGRRDLQGTPQPSSPGGATRMYARKRISPYKVAPAMLPWLSANIASFDVVHIHALFSFAPTVAAWAARWQGIPYIIRPLGTLNRYGMGMRRRRLKQLSVSLIERTNLANAAAVHFTTHAELEEAAAQGLAFRGAVIPIGVEPEPAHPGFDLHRQYPQLAGRQVVLFLSRIDPKKNIEALIDAFAASPALQAGSALVIAGNGTPAYMGALRQRAMAAGVNGLILWLGHVEGAAKVAAFAGADVFVLPSYSENFGIAAVEAMLAELPCVLGRGVAISDEVAGASAGLTVAPEAGAVARALETLQAHPGLRRDMALQARALADLRYSLSAMTERLIELYDEVHRTRPRAAPHGLAANAS
jgi:glycosyltransferase involved in cell wall biosynthesis